MERWYLLVTEKFLFWAFPWWEIRLWKYDIYWLLKSFCFELFGDGKYSLFLFHKIDIKIIFTWYFWVFRDIPGPGKYGFSCSGFSSWIFSFFLFVYILRFAFLCFMPHYMDKVSWRLYYFYFSLLLLKLVAQVYIYSVGKKKPCIFPSCGSCRRYPYIGISQDNRESILYMLY